MTEVPERSVQRRGGPMMLVGAQWARWRRWNSGSDNRAIFSAAVIIGISIVAVKGVSTVKDLVVASSFGTNDELDAFLVAGILPTFAVSLITGSFGAALVPTYMHVRKERGRDAADVMLSSVTFATIAILAGFTCLLLAVAHWVLPLLSTGFDGDKRELALKLMYLMVPSIIFSG